MTAISHRLLIDGNQMDESLLSLIQQIEAEEHTSLASMLRLRFPTAVASSGGRWEHVDDGIFGRLTPLQLGVSIDDRPEIVIIRAHVISINAAFSNQPKDSSFEVVAMDPSVLMNLEEKVRPWPDMSDSDIANAIFREHGLDSKVSDTSHVRDSGIQSCIQRGSDMAFLRGLAQRNGFDCYLEPNSESGRMEGHFHPPQLSLEAQGVLSINLGENTNVRSFRAYYDMLRPTAGISHALVDHECQTLQKERSNWDTLGLDLPDNGSGHGTGHGPWRRTLMPSQGRQEPSEISTLIQSRVNRAQWAVMAEGELSVSAFKAVLRARRPVLVRGAGRDFSGPYFVEKVLHIFNQDGYTQRFLLRRNALGLRGDESFVQSQEGG